MFAPTQATCIPTTPAAIGDLLPTLEAEILADPRRGLSSGQDSDRAFAKHEASRELDRRSRDFRAFVSERPAYAKCAFANFDTVGAHAAKKRDKLKKVMRYANALPDRLGRCNNLILAGPCGSGKDHLAVAVCKTAICRYGIRCHWLIAQDWFGDVRDDMASATARERDRIGRLAAVKLLLVSDPAPQAGELTPHQVNMLYRLVDARVGHSHPTIVTINVKNGPEAAGRLGAATWDRLRHRAWVLNCNWPSYRRVEASDDDD